MKRELTDKQRKLLFAQGWKGTKYVGEKSPFTEKSGASNRKRSSRRKGLTIGATAAGFFSGSRGGSLKGGLIGGAAAGVAAHIAGKYAPHLRRKKLRAKRGTKAKGFDNNYTPSAKTVKRNNLRLKNRVNRGR